MPKGIPNKRYTPEFKKRVVEAVIQDGLSYQEVARIYEVQGHDRIKAGSGYTWKKVRKVLPLSGEDAGAPAGQRNCQARWKKICWPRSSGCAQRTLT